MIGSHTRCLWYTLEQFWSMFSLYQMNRTIMIIIQSLFQEATHLTTGKYFASDNNIANVSTKFLCQKENREVD